jgi:uncharacterized protein Usg
VFWTERFIRVEGRHALVDPEHNQSLAGAPAETIGNQASEWEHSRMESAMTDRDFRAQMTGFSLTTAEILYHLPDHPSLLQQYVWQDYDLHPQFPKLKGFLEFWTRNLEGRLHRIRVAHKGLISPAELRLHGGELRLH